MSTKSFTVGSISVNAAMASAIAQDEVLSVISSEIIQRAAVAARGGLEMGEKILVPMFMAMPSQAKQRVVNVLLERAFVSGTERKVSVADFQGRMVEYNTLLAQILLWNFEDFFTWLSDAVRSDAPAQEATAP